MSYLKEVSNSINITEDKIKEWLKSIFKINYAFEDNKTPDEDDVWDICVALLKFIDESEFKHLIDFYETKQNG